MKVKLRKTDRLFSEIIRITYKYTCQKCGRVYREDGALGNLGVSHYWSRSRESVRYDTENVTLLCNLPCHRKWETEERADYTAYMVERLGQKGYDLLMLRANTYQKRDDKVTVIILQAHLEELKRRSGSR